MIYFLLLLFVVALWISKEENFLSDTTSEKRYCYSIIAVLVILAAIRGSRIGGLGADDFSFIDDYNNLGNYTFGQIYERWQSYFGYYALSKCFHLIGCPARIWFAILEAFYLFSLFKLVDRYSKDKILSLIVFICIGLMGSSFTHLKQILSASFATLSLLSFIDKKYVRTFVFLGLAFFTHTSSLVILLLFALYFFRNSRFYYVIIAVITFILFTQRESILLNAVSFIGDEHFEMYLDMNNTYSYVTFIYYLVLLILCFLRANIYSNQNKGESRFLYGSCILACSCQLFAAFNPSLFRLANFFSPFFMLLIPNMANMCSDNERKVFSIVFMSMMAFFLLYTTRNDPYIFMWEQ